MSAHRHTKESIIQTLQNVASTLGTQTLSKADVAKHLPPSSVNYHFGSIGKALEAAGLSVTGRDFSAAAESMRLGEDELFKSLWAVEQLIGKEPNLSEYRANGGEFSNMPFRDRFGKWENALEYYRKWKADRNGAPIPADSLSVDGEAKEALCSTAPPQSPSDQPPAKSGVLNRKPPQLFGEPIDFRGLRHAPINEQGVVYLFGMVSRELGFSVEALQQGFPDCEGKYLHDKNRKLWAKARIEFEFRASNFREHHHDENECDVIVCWENDWPECPLRVVELRSEIMRLPSR